MINAAVLVSGDGAEIQPLLDSFFFGEIKGVALAAVISSRRDAYALTRARGINIPCYVVEEAIFPNGASFNLALLNKLRDLDIDLVIVAGFEPRIGEGTARAYHGRAIGIRLALSPAFDTARQVDVTREALRRGVKWTGATVYLLDDSGGVGEILLQKPVFVDGCTDPEELRRKIIGEAAGAMLVQAVKMLPSE